MQCNCLNSITFNDKNPDEDPSCGIIVSRADRAAGDCSLIYKKTVMEQKIYELAAWTEGDRVRMIRSVAYEQTESFTNEINVLVDDYANGRDKPGCLLKISSLYERLGNFMLQCGCRTEAFAHYCESAGICLCGRDIDWLEREDGYTISYPLRIRFFKMYDLCMQMVAETPELEGTYHKMMLDIDRRSISTD